jgi:hypothetical protein
VLEVREAGPGSARPSLAAIGLVGTLLLLAFGTGLARARR